MSWREPVVLLYHDENQLFCYFMTRTNCSAMSWREPIVLLYHDENQCVLLYHDENHLFCYIMTRTNVFCYVMTRTNCSAISWREPIVLLYHDENQLFCCIMTRTNYISTRWWWWWWCSLCTRRTRLVKSLLCSYFEATVDMSLHSGTIHVKTQSTFWLPWFIY
jgi:hypothetical protein